MSIRGKIIFVVLPLIVLPLLLTGFIGALAARNGLTTIATEFLRFKVEEIANYANSQYTLLVTNNLIDDKEYVEISKTSIGSFARSIVRSDTELILAFDDSASVQLRTKEVDIDPEELSEVRGMIAEKRSGWHRGCLRKPRRCPLRSPRGHPSQFLPASAGWSHRQWLNRSRRL